MSRRAWPTFAVAAALALGPAVSLGLARFAYALLLPPMRSDLGWSYLTAGAMNTVNAAGYLVGALAMPAALRRVDARSLFLVGGAGAALALAAHAAVIDERWLFVLRFITGVGSAASFVAGGLLAARLAAAPGAGAERRNAAGTVIGLYYGGTGIGIVAASVLVPWLAGRAVAHAWQGAWLALGGLALVVTAVAAVVTRHAPGLAASTARPAAGEHMVFAWRAFAPALIAYLLFGLGYIGYMTFIVTLLREQQIASVLVNAFFGMLGVSVLASSWVWARVLQRFRGGEALSLFNALLALATLLPIVSTHPLAVFGSGLLFGGVFLSLVASTTALVRHNVGPAAWQAGIAAFAIVFAAGQIIGPTLLGVIADRLGGLRGGFACSAAVLAVASFIAWRQKPVPARA